MQLLNRESNERSWVLRACHGNTYVKQKMKMVWARWSPLPQSISPVLQVCYRNNLKCIWFLLSFDLVDIVSLLGTVVQQQEWPDLDKQAAGGAEGSWGQSWSAARRLPRPGEALTHSFHSSLSDRDVFVSSVLCSARNSKMRLPPSFLWSFASIKPIREVGRQATAGCFRHDKHFNNCLWGKTEECSMWILLSNIHDF